MAKRLTSYGERVQNVEKGSFVPIVFTTTGGTGPKTKKLLQRLAEKISAKRKERYSDILNFIRTKLRCKARKVIGKGASHGEFCI